MKKETSKTKQPCTLHGVNGCFSIYDLMAIESALMIALEVKNNKNTKQYKRMVDTKEKVSAIVNK